MLGPLWAGSLQEPFKAIGPLLGASLGPLGLGAMSGLVSPYKASYSALKV